MAGPRVAAKAQHDSFASDRVEFAAQIGIVSDHQPMARLLGIAFVQGSTLMRGAMRAVFWLNRLVYPYVIVRQLADAIAWAEGRCQAQLPTG